MVLLIKLLGGMGIHRHEILLWIVLFLIGETVLRVKEP